MVGFSVERIRSIGSQANGRTKKGGNGEHDRERGGVAKSEDSELISLLAVASLNCLRPPVPCSSFRYLSAPSTSSPLLARHPSPFFHGPRRTGSRAIYLGRFFLRPTNLRARKIALIGAQPFQLPLLPAICEHRINPLPSLLPILYGFLPPFSLFRRVIAARSMGDRRLAGEPRNSCLPTETVVFRGDAL